MATFRVWLTENLAPPFLRKPIGTKYLGLVADAFDTMSNAAKEAVKASFPELCATDALPYNGAARNIERYLYDTNNSYRFRIKDPWAIWDFAGSSTGILDKVHRIGYSNFRIFGWYQLQPNVPDRWRNWYSAFWVWLENTGITTDGNWDDSGTWGDTVTSNLPISTTGPGVWDCSLTLYQVLELRSAIRKWKSGHEVCASISFSVSGDRWENTTPFDSGVWGADDTINIPG